MLKGDGGKKTQSLSRLRSPPYRQIQEGGACCGVVVQYNESAVCVCASNIFLTGRTSFLPLAGADLNHTTCCAIPCCQNC